MIMSQYAQDLEEIYRAVIARGMVNTSALMQTYANSSPNKNTVSLREFGAALHSLSLSRQWKDTEIE